MKSIYTIIALLATSVAFSQTTLISEDFESYSYPSTLLSNTETEWIGWSQNAQGSAQDAEINNEIFSSGSQSLLVTGDGPGGFSFNDLIIRMPNNSTYTNGQFEVKLKFYVEEGEGGYFNLGSEWPGYDQNHEIGARVFFHADGSGQLDIDEPVEFSYNLNEWNNVSLIVDLDNSVKSLFINDQLITENDPWDSSDGFGLLNILGVGYSTFGIEELIFPGIFYDDLEITALTDLSLQENSENNLQMKLYPSPSNGEFHVELTNYTNNTSVRITDLTGKTILEKHTDINTKNSFELSVEPGVYLISVLNSKGRKTQKLIIE